MQKLNKDGSVEAFTLQLATAEAAANQPADGLIIGPDDDLDTLASIIASTQLVAIDFPVFSDGRGFSIARLVRDKFGFKGELLAYGNFMQDQLHYLKRCGFDGFIVADDAALDSMRASLADFSDAYQASADNPLPLFRRRSA